MIAGFGLILAFIGGISGAAVADAPASTYSVGSSPVVNVAIGNANVTIKTWDRSEVQTDSSTALKVTQFGPQVVARNLPRQMDALAGSVQTPRGEMSLPAESFPLSSVSNEPHDGLTIKGNGGEATIMIPQNTSLVLVHAGVGQITIQDYRGGTFFVQLHTGFVHLQNSGGDGFVQVLRGGVVAQDSTFTRLRVRNIAGGVAFERCNARQIQVSSTMGQILYDNGSFEPGFARFESQYGRVAIGIGNGNAQIGAHSDAGRIFTNFERHANFGGTSSDATASFGNSGPMVNVSAGAGVFLYDGTIRTRASKGENWQQFGEALGRLGGRPAGAGPQIPQQTQRNATPEERQNTNRPNANRPNANRRPPSFPGRPGRGRRPPRG